MAKRKPRTIGDQQLEKLEQAVKADERKKKTKTERDLFRTTVYIFKDQWAKLNRTSAKSQTEGDGLNRASLLRVAIDFINECGVDLSKVDGEEEALELLLAQVKKKK